MTEVQAFSEKVGFIWSVADLLRGTYMQHEYGPVADSLTDRQAANDTLFRMFWDKPEFQQALTAWARRETYGRIQRNQAGAA